MPVSVALGAIILHSPPSSRLLLLLPLALALLLQLLLLLLLSLLLPLPFGSTTTREGV